MELVLDLDELEKEALKRILGRREKEKCFECRHLHCKINPLVIGCLRANCVKEDNINGIN